MDEIPVVRHFIACENINVSAGGQQCTLDNVIHVIRAVPSGAFPCLRPMLCLYTIMANGRGRHTFTVVLMRGVGPKEVEIHRTPTFTRDLGQNPLVVHGLPIRLRNLVFNSPGQYEFQFLCDGNVIASEMIEVK